MADAVTCAKNATAAVVDSLGHKYTQVRVILGIAAGGGLSALIEMFQDGSYDLSNKQGRAALLHAFIKGAVVAVIFHFVPRPIKPGTADAKALDKPCEDAPNPPASTEGDK